LVGLCHNNWRKYIEVGNGGFGHGFMALENIEGISGQSVVELYQSFCTEDPEDEQWIIKLREGNWRRYL